MTFFILQQQYSKFKRLTHQLLNLSRWNKTKTIQLASCMTSVSKLNLFHVHSHIPYSVNLSAPQNTFNTKSLKTFVYKYKVVFLKKYFAIY